MFLGLTGMIIIVGFWFELQLCTLLTRMITIGLLFLAFGWEFVFIINMCLFVVVVPWLFIILHIDLTFIWLLAYFRLFYLFLHNWYLFLTICLFCFSIFPPFQLNIFFILKEFLLTLSSTPRFTPAPFSDHRFTSVLDSI